MANNRYLLRRPMLGLFAAALAYLMSSSAQAALLNLTLQSSPDILSGFIQVTYIESTDSFTANGTAFELRVDDVPNVESIAMGTFSLAATIDASGGLSSGSLTVDGTIASLGFNSGTLLTGSLTAFGFNPAGGNPLEFRFDVTGGDAAGLFGSAGGVILSDTGFGGSFALDWSNNGFATADTAPEVPVPAAVWLFGSGLMMLFGAARQQKQS